MRPTTPQPAPTPGPGAADRTIETLRTELAAAQAQLQENTREISNLKAQLAGLAVKAVAPKPSEDPAARPYEVTNLASELSAAVTSVNSTMRGKSDSGGPSLRVTDFAVEIRGTMHMDGKKVMMTAPQGQALTAESASVVRFALRPEAVLRIPDQESK